MLSGHRLAFHWIFLAWTSVSLLLIAAGQAQPPTARPPAGAAQLPESSAESIPGADKIGALVRDLGDPRFAVRQQAQGQLAAIGAAAKPALVAALKSPDAEVRRRARQLLPDVLADDYRRRLEAFIAHAPESDANRLPGWRRFRELAGDDAGARELFAEMAAAEPLLLEAIEQGPEAAARAVDIRCHELISHRDDDPFGGGSTCIINVPPHVLGTFGALLLASAHPGVRIEDSSHQVLMQMSQRPATTDVVNTLCLSSDNPTRVDIVYTTTDEEEHDDADSADQQWLAATKKIEQLAQDKRVAKSLRLLLRDWINHFDTSEQATHCLSVTLMRDLDEGLTIARRVLREPNNPPSLRRLAILTVARFGSVADLGVLSPLLDDATACDAEPEEPKECRQEVRDIALSAMIHLSSQRLASYGITSAKPNIETVYDVDSLKFGSRQQRDAAIKKWRFWAAVLAPAKPTSGSALLKTSPPDGGHTPYFLVPGVAEPPFRLVPTTPHPSDPFETSTN